MRRAPIFLSLCALLFAAPIPACTTFCLRDGDNVLFRRNYDFMIGDGMLVVNQRGLTKQSLSEHPAKWVSRFGSVTFNQFGREFPTGGMNEKGLVVELMWLDGARYPAADARPALGVLEWIQYHLDRHATVDELIQGSEKIRIASGIPLHYLVADRSGAAATIEFLEGKLVVHRGEDLPVPVLANDSYFASLQNLRAHQGFGGNKPLPASPRSLDRFATAATMLRDAERGNAIDHAFDILARVSQPRSTQWSIVYDQRNLAIHYRTMANPARRSLSLRSFKYDCGSTVLILDVDSGRGDVSETFVRYSEKENRNLVTRSYRGVPFLQDTPPAELDQAVKHAGSMQCAR